MDREVLLSPGDFERILVHELFHFSWVRLGNPMRAQWSSLLGAELDRGIPGELGWSAEWRKRKLRPRDWLDKTPRWRRYICESYCDSASWLYAGLSRHAEFTLEDEARRTRRDWFLEHVRNVSI
jgi:hypothetical protein